MKIWRETLAQEKRKDLALGILFPRRCPVCRGIVRPEGAYICRECRDLLPFVRGPVCYRCGKPLTSPRQEYCRDCSEKRRSFEQGSALLRYRTEDGLTARILHELKYSNRREYAETLAEEMYLKMGGRFRAWNAQAMIPVPVHPARLRARGYNQASLLARGLGRRLKLPVAAGLERVRKTVPQKELNENQRLKNLLSAFRALPEAGQWEKIILVDDIFTTGSTAEACTRALLKTGVKKVYVVCAAIGAGRETVLHEQGDS